MTAERVMAERAFLQCAISENIKEVIAWFKPEYIGDGLRRDIYKRCVTLYGQGEALDFRVVSMSMPEAEKEIIAIFKIYDVMLTNIRVYADRVRNLFKADKVKELASTLTAADPEKVDSVICQTMEQLSSLVHNEESSTYTLQEMADKFIPQILNPATNSQAIKTGFGMIDRETHGLTGGNLYVIGARPGGGKSLLALKIANNIDNNKLYKGKKIAYYNLEMGRHEMVCRVLAMESGVSLNDIQASVFEGKQLADRDKKLISNAWNKFKSSSILFPSVSGYLTPSKVLFQNKYREDVGLIIIDYLQLMHTNERSNGSRYETVTELSLGLKQVSMELDVPILLLSQLNRLAEDEEPSMAHLRESGQIEQDASVVLLMWKERDEEYGIDKNYMKIAKNRNGRTDIKTQLRIDGEHMRITDLTNI